MPTTDRVRPGVRAVLGPLGVAAVLGIAAVSRFWALGQPDSLVFDELYYVRDAITQLAHGFPTGWPDADPHMGAPSTGDASYAVHPPLGKWLIALGLLVFGDDSGWGWRSGAAFFGTLTVAVTMRLGWRITRSVWVSLFAGLLLAIDGVHIVLSRVALLDGFLAFFIVVGALWMWRDHETVVDRGRLGSMQPRLLWHRPWLIAAAGAFGAAAAVKWSGLYPLAAFLLLTAARDAWLRVSEARAHRSAQHENGRSEAGFLPAPRAIRPWSGALAQALITGLIALPTAFTVYLASWWGWIATSGGWGRDLAAWPVALWRYHVDMFGWHSTLSAPHPYQSHPLGWPLGLTPTAMYREHPATGLTAAISPMPNLLVTWGGVIALLVLAWWIARRLGFAHWLGFARRSGSVQAGVPLSLFAMAFVLIGYLSGWLPWVLTFSRSAVFQFYTVVLTPFAALALAIVIAVVCGLVPHRVPDPGPPARAAAGDDGLLGRRLAATLFLTVATAVSILFFPVWSGGPITDWFWQLHLWLPGWG